MDDSEEVASFYDKYGEELGLTGDFDHLNPVLPDISGKRVLDAGCGKGRLSNYLYEQGADVTGIDISGELISVAQEEYGDKMKMEFYQADLTEPLEFLEDGSFDTVVCTLALSHIKEWDKVFKEFYRVLNESGSVVVHAHHPFVDYLEIDVEDSEMVTEDSACYSDIESFGRPWGPDGEIMPFYRRPLGEMLRPALEADFVLEEFVEPNAGDHETERYPSSSPPRHLLYRLRKLPES